MVDPKMRRAASSYIAWNVFQRIQQNKDIQIGSQTVSVTLQPQSREELKSQLAAPGDEQPKAA